MLVAGGARLNIRDLSGNTPRELAMASDDRELAAYLHSEYFIFFFSFFDLHFILVFAAFFFNLFCVLREKNSL